MLIVLAVPVMVAVAFVHRGLEALAPSSIVTTRVRRTARPSYAGALLFVLALLMLIGARLLAAAVARSAPDWVHLFVAILAWDALRFTASSVSITVIAALRRGVACASALRRRVNGAA